MFAEYPVATSSNTAKNINATGRFDVRNYGSRRIILSADDTKDLQDVNEETTESDREEMELLVLTSSTRNTMYYVTGPFFWVPAAIFSVILLQNKRL